MTTTVPVKGQAIPIRNSASGLTIGRRALRVYGFADAASAVASGFGAVGGGANPIYLVSAAELESGAFILDGDPVAQAIYNAPWSSPPQGGYAQPVYLVGGSLSGAAGSIYLLDRFTAGDGVLLAAHALETGETWTAAGGSELSILNNAAKVIGFDAGDNGNVCRDTVPLPAALVDNFSVEAIFTPRFTGAYERGFCVRFQDNTNHFKISTSTSGANSLKIIEVNGGVETLRAAVDSTFSNGTPYKFRVSVISNIITATWNTASVSYASAFLAGENDVAIFSTFEDGNIETIDNFLAWGGDAAPPANPLYP